MDEKELQDLANEAFAAIKKNTTQEYRHAKVSEAFFSFRRIAESRGVAWLIDATDGTGLTHLGWTEWMRYARLYMGVDCSACKRRIPWNDEIAEIDVRYRKLLRSGEDISPGMAICSECCDRIAGIRPVR
jgi:hypothetical protein